MLLTLTALAFAQSDNGSLSGRVTDASDAVVAGAKVSITNDATGVTIPATTNQDGIFQYPSLPVGSYTVEAEHPGFKRTRQTGIRIDVATRASIVRTACRRCIGGPFM